jgi:outer membrane immunogenic protein
MMRTLFASFGAVALLGASSAAFPAWSQEGHDWSGAYVGVHGGHAWGASEYTDAEYNGGFLIYPVVNWDVGSDGPLAGIHGGYNLQHGSFVVGIEGELGYLGLDGSAMQPGVDPVGVAYDAGGVIEKGLYGGLSLRLGVAFDRTLLYGKGGAVYSTAKVGFLDACDVAPCGNILFDASEEAGWGYQLGGGVEHALTDNWSIRGEYSYLDFGSVGIDGTMVGGGRTGDPAHVDADLAVHAFRIGVNYDF